MSAPDRYIVICQQIVGGDRVAIETAYGWDGKFFPRKDLAISHGFKIRGSDDFNIGVVNWKGRLIEFRWMEKPLEYPLGEIANQIGLSS